MESGSSNDFTDISVRVVERFLQTVVIVDDQAGYESNYRHEQPKKTVTPNRSARKSTNQEVNTDEHTNVKIGNRLNTKLVVDSFASKGIVCSVLEPSDEKYEMTKQIYTIAKRADVFIIDWQIGDDGSYTQEIISELIASDLKEGSRLRLIIIYTGEINLVSIYDKVKEVENKFSFEFKSNKKNLSLSLNHLRIVILRKGEEKTEGDKEQEKMNREATYPNNTVSEDRLPTKVISEFADMTKGLVSNVVLESLSVLRQNTPIILGNLSSEMDPPYLAHRALLPEPEDATSHIVDIISSELRSIMDDCEVGEIANDIAFKAWLDMKTEKCQEFKLELGKTKKEYVTCDDLCDIVKNGFRNSGWLDRYITTNHRTISDPEGKKSDYEKDVYKNLTKTFCLEGEDSNRLNLEFAILCSLNSTYGKSSNGPILTLGTILKISADEVSDSSPQYWLCIQPRCDSFRIEECRKFVFLQLMTSKSEESKFDLVISDNSEHINLTLSY